MAEKGRCDEVLNLAGQGLAILVIVGQTKIHLCLLVYTIQSILITEMNYTRLEKHFGRLSGHLHFGGLTFGRIIKSNHVEFTHYKCRLGHDQNYR